MSKTVIAFGRMNPPTVGHQKVVDKVKAEAKKQGAMPHVFLSHSQDKKKNPLDYNTKLNTARKAFGSSVTRSDARTIIEVMVELQKMQHTEVTVIVGSDRVREFKTLLNKYNGKDFKFDKITVKSAGARDPDAEGAAGMSATKMRTAAQTGDYKSFKKGAPTALSDRDIKAMYDKIRSEMGAVKEEIEWSDEDFEFTDAELDAAVEMMDFDKLDEDQEIDEEFTDYLDEVRKPLSVQQRMAIGRRMKRLAPRMARMRKIRKMRMADRPRLEKRARKAAIKLLRKRFAGKQGANYASLAPGAKMQVDRIIQKKIAIVGKIAKRLLPKVRKSEMERLKSMRSSKAAAKKNTRAAHPWSESYKKEEFIWEEEDEGTNQKLITILRQAFRDPTERNLVIRALKGGEKSLKNPKLRPFMLKLLTRLLDATQDDPSMLAKMRDKLRRMSQADDVKEAEDPDIGHRKGSQPAKYHAGLSVSTKKKRDAHFKKHGPMADDDPRGYKPAPGDATAKTKPSVHTKKYRQMYGEDFNAAFNNFMAEQYIEEKALEGLKKKSEKSGIPYSILKKVYDRGMAAWQTGHRPGTTPQQWAYARVNSYITKGKTYHTTDKDLRENEEEDRAKEAIKREKQADKRKHDSMLDRARLRDTRAKNRAESVDEKFENMLSEQFTAGISDTMYAMDFKEHKVQGGFALHPSVKEQSGAGEEGTKKLVKKYKKDTPGEMTEAIEFMKKHDIDIVENIYRPLSEKYFEFFREARRMMQEGEMEFSGLDKQILETDLGEFDWYEDMEVPLDCPMVAIEEEAEPELNKPKRGGSKKYYVYVRNPDTGNIKKVEWGDTTGLKVKINDPAARKSFAARHQCDTRNDKTKASYWACRLPRYAKSLGLQVDNPGSWW